MKYLLIAITLLFLGCADTYNKTHLDVDCRDGELYGTMYLGTYVDADVNVSQPKYYLGTGKIETADGSTITCKEATK